VDEITGHANWLTTRFIHKYYIGTRLKLKLQLYGSLRLFVLKHLNLISNTTPTKPKSQTTDGYIVVTMS